MLKVKHLMLPTHHTVTIIYYVLVLCTFFLSLFVHCGMINIINTGNNNSNNNGVDLRQHYEITDDCALKETLMMITCVFFQALTTYLLMRVHSENDSRMYFLIVLTNDYCWRSWTSRIAAPYKSCVDWLIDISAACACSLGILLWRKRRHCTDHGLLHESSFYLQHYSPTLAQRPAQLTASTFN